MSLADSILPKPPARTITAHELIQRLRAARELLAADGSWVAEDVDRCLAEIEEHLRQHDGR